jgi:hypothetical protein
MHGGWLLGWLQPYACFLVTFRKCSGNAARLKAIASGAVPAPQPDEIA